MTKTLQQKRFYEAEKAKTEDPVLVEHYIVFYKLFNRFVDSNPLTLNSTVHISCLTNAGSVTRLGDLLNFGPLFKSLCNYYLPKSLSDFQWNHFWATFIDIWRLFPGHTVHAPKKSADWEAERGVKKIRQNSFQMCSPNFAQNLAENSHSCFYLKSDIVQISPNSWTFRLLI